MEKILAAGLFVVILLTILSLHKINKMSRKITNIVAQVEHYLSVIMEEDTQEADATRQTYTKEGSSITEQQKQQSFKIDEKTQKEEAQSRIITSVLQEMFP